MSGLVAATDWERTPLGPREHWPLELRTVLDVVLGSRFPMVFWWGPDLIQLYNDAYLPIMGGKHPVALGQTARACWSEIWDAIGPQLLSIQNGGPATWNEDVLLDINRHGFVGESYFTWSYSPLPQSGGRNGIGGILCTVTETTERVIGERRILLLRDLAVHGTDSKSAEDECRVAAATLERFSRSVPFSLIYLIDDAGTTAHLAAASRIEGGASTSFPATIDLAGTGPGPWRIREALAHNATLHIPDLAAVVEHVPAGPWPEPAREAVVVPIQSTMHRQPAGVLIAGVNPREHFDDRYRSFYELIAGQIAAAIASARAYENERRRAEALAELDRVKVDFFSNISHEFRTPLTLMLGPLEELLRKPSGPDTPLLETAHRNALRLLKLVNTLLEFTRLEAGRTEATFVETDLATFTEELCGMFQSAIESAGLRFDVSIDLAEHVFVDRSMWEMIVLNLLSNAIKFTHEGTIELSLRVHGAAARMSIRDSGIGIPPDDVTHIFERFRRVRGAQSRSHEGSGIGLALVDELVRLHGGTIAVTSTVGSGSEFTVDIPLGRAHLNEANVASPERPVSHSRVVDQYLADVASTTIVADDVTPHAAGDIRTGRILLADDNADLRTYVSRILSQHHDVVAVRNGVEALRALRESHFDLVVSDGMMPEMDGFELIRHIRDDFSLETLPVILLSARAGEGAAVDGLERGADDYLVKPFSGAELLARIHARLSAAAIRESSTERSTQIATLFAEASRLLAESLDLDAMLQRLATLAVPAFADWCQIDLRLNDGGIRTVAIAHHDREKDELAQRFVGRVHLNPNAGRAVPHVIRTGSSDLISDVGAIAGETVDDDTELQLYRRLGLHSAACVPLVADGETIGALSLNYGDSERTYRLDDLPVFEELGRRAGVAVRRAREFEREHRVAQSFQEASLPATLPSLPGLTFDAVYIPAKEEAQVGGDWYDAVRLADGRIVVSIGDVAGNGLRAAVTMGNMRQIIRGIAQVHADPALMLDAADRALRLERPDEFVTAFVGVFDPITFTFTYASAGHPPPMLRRPDGTVEMLSDGGLPLGLRYAAKGHGNTIAAHAGSSIIFYTDGLIEHARRPADGEDRLVEVLRDGSVLRAVHPAHALRDAIFGRSPATDDVAILVLRVEEADDDLDADVLERWDFETSDARSAQAARKCFTDGLAARGADDDCISKAESVFGELVGNAARYAPGHVDVVVDWSGPAPVLHVLDNGSGFQHVSTLPLDVYSESGRGLFMISQLSATFTVTRRREGGSHARAVLAFSRRARSTG